MIKMNFAVLFILASFAVISINAQTDKNALNIKGNDKRVTYDCENRNVTVTGNNHIIVLKGTCNTLRVSGGNHKVSVDVVGLITVSGTQNSIVWKRAKGKRKRPPVNKSGYNNSVKRYRVKKKQKK